MVTKLCSFKLDPAADMEPAPAGRLAGGTMEDCVDETSWCPVTACRALGTRGTLGELFSSWCSLRASCC